MQICSNCGAEMKLVPAGTSKRTGKEYEAFMSCPNNRERGCPTTPVEAQNSPVSNEKVKDRQQVLTELIEGHEYMIKLLKEYY